MRMAALLVGPTEPCRGGMFHNPAKATRCFTMTVCSCSLVDREINGYTGLHLTGDKMVNHDGHPRLCTEAEQIKSLAGATVCSISKLFTYTMYQWARATVGLFGLIAYTVPSMVKTRKTQNQIKHSVCWYKVFVHSTPNTSLPQLAEQATDARVSN